MMKKYLMTAFAAVAMGAAFTSCSHNDDEYQPAPEKTDAEKLESAFEQTFGKIDPTNDWGFGNAALSRGTRGVDANGNEWGLYVEVPQPLTTTQINKVTKWFNENQNPKGVAVNWSDFFVQQVHKGEWGSNMNYLYCGSETDHTNNFNAGDGGVYGNVCYGLQPGATDQNQRIYGSDKIEFMVNSSTEYFGFHNSFDSNFYKDNYVIIPGEVIDPNDASLAGMYFVGFDFEANGQSANQKVARDYYFNNWIVKITPGIYKSDKTWRVFAEDLIGENLDDIQASDWDFNDAVFDVYVDRHNFLQNYDPNKPTQTVIVLYAAGGTKHLTVGGVEVHEAFGVKDGSYPMINTEGSSIEKPVAIFRLNQVFNNPNEVKVVLENSIELTAKTGNVPMKLCVPTGTKWLKEKTLISLGYPNFPKYVENANANSTWYNNAVNSYLVNK